ncbi:MAG: hypothetical protein ACI9WU_000011 [Myxococcota bacterium]|jgi:hypothetical protein
MRPIQSVRLVAFFILTLLVVEGCKKPRKFVRTRQQQEKVDQSIMSEAPKPAQVSNANLGDKVKLLGMDIEPANPAPGAKVTLHFYWEVIADMPEDGDWMIFVHLEGPADGGGVARVIADHYAVEDGPGGAGLYPPGEWQKGQIIKDTKTVDLVDPRGRKVGPGEVTVYTGLFDMEAYKTRQADVRLELKNAGDVANDGKGRVIAAKFRAGTGTVKPAKKFIPPTLQVRRAAAPLTLDGKLDEAAWRGAVTTPALGRPDGKPLPAAMRTQVRMLWDDEALWVGFLVRDKEPKSKFTKRDETLWDEDVVEVYLDPDADGKQYVELQVSPKNVIFDALFSSRRTPKWQEAAKWNMPGLQTAVNIGKLPGRAGLDGWTVEMRIPWAGLADAKGSKPAVGARWRANFFRKELPGDFTHLAAWSAVSDDARADFHNLDRAGWLVFAETPEAVKTRVLSPGAVPAMPRQKQPTLAPTPAPTPVAPTAAPAPAAPAPAAPAPAAPVAKPPEVKPAPKPAALTPTPAPVAN